MSGGGWKEPFYKVAQQDSRNLAWLGNAVGWQGLEDEANHNVKNPGRAITKAAEYAALGYLGGLYGGLYDGVGAAAGAGAGAAADGAAAGATAGTTAQQVATADALQQGLIQAQAAPVTDLSVNAVPVADRTAQAGFLDKAKFALSSGSSTGKGSSSLAAQYGLGLLNQQPQQPAMAAPPPRQQASPEPLPLPYGQRMDSLGMGLTEEEKRRRLMMQRGYR